MPAFIQLVGSQFHRPPIVDHVDKRLHHGQRHIVFGTLFFLKTVQTADMRHLPVVDQLSAVKERQRSADSVGIIKRRDVVIRIRFRVDRPSEAELPAYTRTDRREEARHRRMVRRPVRVVQMLLLSHLRTIFHRIAHAVVHRPVSFLSYPPRRNRDT